MKKTEYLQLRQPENTDNINIEELNYNFSKIDSHLRRFENLPQELYNINGAIENIYEKLEEEPEIDLVDQTYNPESANAQSGKALKPIFENRLAVWTHDTKYNKGQYILAELATLDENTGEKTVYTAILYCIEDHIASSDDLNEVTNGFSDLWVIVTQVSASSSVAACRDWSGNVIHTTYATKEEFKSKQDTLVSGENIKTVNGQSLLGNGDIVIESGSGETVTVDQSYNPNSSNAQSGKAVAEAIGSIETALDNIITIQNSLIGGDVV